MLKIKTWFFIIVFVSIIFIFSTNVFAANSTAKITSMEVKSPEDGVYGVGQTITVRLNFSKPLKGNMPEIDVYVGTYDASKIKTLTIPEITQTTSYVDYTYTIASGDTGEFKVYKIRWGVLIDENGDTCSMSLEDNTQRGNKVYADTTIDWADASNVAFEWRGESDNSRELIYLKVNNVTFKQLNTYYVHISHNKNESIEVLDRYSVSRDSAIWDRSIDKEKSELTQSLHSYIAENGDIYIWICEIDKETDIAKIIVNGKKVERKEQLPLGSRLKAYFFNTETSTNCHETSGEVGGKYKRNIKYKIGKVTDVNLLKSIQKGEKDCLAKLLEYAKTNTGTATGTLKLGKDVSIMDNLNVVNGEYYFVYLELDDEGGKFYKVEDVSLYQALVGESIGKNLFDYLDDNFKWNLSDETGNNNSTSNSKDDDTVYPKDLPKTGIISAAIGVIIAITGITIYIKSREKYREI